MKTNKFFAAFLIGIVAFACTPKAGEQAETAEAAEPAAEAVEEIPAKKITQSMIDSVAYLVGINFGSFIKGYDFGELPYGKVKQGMNDFIKAKGNPRDEEFAKQFKISPEEMNTLFNEYLELRRNEKLAANKAAEEKFLAKNGQKEGVQTTESGLQYKIIEPGTDKKATSPKDTVWVLYKGTTLDGEVFDEAKDEPVRFILNRVIPAWTEGMQLVGEGGEVELYCPAALAYGERGNQGIEPNATLIFNVKIDKVGNFVEKEEAAK